MLALANNSKMQIKPLERFACISLALVYATLLCLFPMEGLADRANYLEMARISPLILARHLGQGLQSFFANEPLWLLINSGLGFIFEDVIVVRIIIFFSAFTTSYLILVKNPRYFLLLLLVLVFPHVMKNFVIHIRQGLAIAVFMLGFYSTTSKKKLLLIGLTPFIHSSFFIIAAIMVGAWFLKKLKTAPDLKIFVYAMGSISLALLVTQLAALIGARQANTTAVMEEATSGIGFLFWVIVLFLLLLQGRRFLQQHIIAMGILILYLASYFFTPIAGRVFESGFLLVILAIISTTGWRNSAVIGMLLAFNTALMVVQYTRPLMGFAATV